MSRNLYTNTVLIGFITWDAGMKREQKGEEENTGVSKPAGKLFHPFKRNYVRSSHYYY